MSQKILTITYSFSLVIALSIAIFSCNKDLEVDPNNNNNGGNNNPTDTVYFSVEGISVSNGVIEEVGFTDVKIKADFSAFSTSSFSVIDYGHVVSKTNSLPTRTDNDGLSNLGARNSVGQFTSMINGLEPQTTYYARVYIEKDDGTFGYHPRSISFSTKNPEPPDVKITSVTNITSTGMSVNGKISDFKGENVLNHGFVWSQSNTSPTKENNDGMVEFGSIDEISSHSYIGALSSLNPGTTYFVRAFAENIHGIGYKDGDEDSTQGITTEAPPEPVLVIDTIEVFSDANNTGEPNPGEEVTFNIRVKNIGLLAANNVIADFQSNKLSVLSSNPVDFGSIVPNGTKTKSIDVKINDNLSWGEIVDLFIAMEDIDGRQWTETYSFEVTSPYVVSENLLYYLDFENQSLFNIGQVENLFGGLNGVINGNIQLSEDSPSNVGFSMDFPGGTENNIRIPGDPLNDSPEFSFSFWIKTSDSEGCIFDGNWKYDFTGTINSANKSMLLNGTKIMSYGTNSNYHITNVLLNNQWHHVVVTKNSQNIQKIYFDGNLFDEFDFYANYNGTYDAVYDSECWIGVDRDDGFYSGDYIGKIDNFRMYNRVLTVLEIQQIYNAKQ